MQNDDLCNELITKLATSSKNVLARRPAARVNRSKQLGLAAATVTINATHCCLQLICRTDVKQ